MKNKIALIIVISLMAAFSIEASPSRFDISVNMFYSSLHPYGTWLEIDNGLIVWRPSNVNRRWKPYTNGRWSWTQHGWYWDSYEAYGWAVYHYGRWFYDDYYGWIWIPDNVWGPSWVEWRYDDNYIGWAPLPPYASFHSSFGIRFTTGWRSHHSYWNFVSYRRFCDPRINYYIVDSKRGSRIFENTKYRTNYFSDRERIVNGGIDRELVERRGGYRVAERDIKTVDNFRDFERSRESRDRSIYAYRPSEREVISERSINRAEITRGERRTALETDKFAIDSNREIKRSGARDSENSELQTREREINRPDVNIGREKNEQLKRETERRIEPKTERTDGKGESSNPEMRTPPVERREPRTERVESKRETNERPIPRVESRPESRNPTPSRSYEAPQSRSNENSKARESAPKRESDRSSGSDRGGSERRR
jgi:hypothetical protein